MIDPLSITIGIVLGLLAGSLLVYVIFNQKRQKQLAQLSTYQAHSEAAAQQSAEHLKARQEAQLAYERREQQIIQLTADLSHMSADYKHLTSRIKEREVEVNHLQEKFKADFELLANRILHQNTQTLSAHNKAQLDQMLEPLKERLVSFEEKVSNTYEKEARERFHLQKEIAQLVQLNMQMSEEANNLTRALKGDNKQQGNWGEMVLNRVLESSGLREGEEFVTQAQEMGLENDQGKKLQPDVLVKLPDDKHIVIDSKVSLTAFERMIDTDDEGEKGTFLRQHLDSISQHVKGLGEKHYYDLKGIHSPDFVLLFMPIEGAFSLAIQAQPDLFTYAWDRRIVIVSPTTLLACLRTVASIWKLERQNQNAQEIARQGGLLYDKFVGFIGEMEKIGKHLDQASRTHDDAMRKLRDGRGNLIGKAEKLKDLGIQNHKKMNDSLKKP